MPNRCILCNFVPFNLFQGGARASARGEGGEEEAEGAEQDGGVHDKLRNVHQHGRGGRPGNDICLQICVLDFQMINIQDQANLADVEEEDDDDDEHDEATTTEDDQGEEEEEDVEEEEEEEEGYAFPIGPLPQQVTNDLKSLDEMVRFTTLYLT